MLTEPQKKTSSWPEVLFSILGVLATIRLFRAGFQDSADFNVYWRATQSWWAGLSPYLFKPHADNGFIFKYPPYIVPLFFPFAFISEVHSRVVWAGAEWIALIYSVRWLLKQGVKLRVALATTFLFWWIWLAHFYAGQFTLMLLFIGLFTFNIKKDSSDTQESFGNSLLFFIFSAKIYPLYSLWGVKERFFKLKTWLFAGILVSILTVILLMILNSHRSPNTPALDLYTLYHQWLHAAFSGGEELGEQIVRGQGNHGFTAGVLRWLKVPSTDSKWDVITAAGFGVFFGALWTRFSKSLTSAEKWAGWLGIGVIIAPLAWHHSFVLAFPLCALALDRCLRSGHKLLVFLALFGIICIGIFVPEVLGHDLVRPLEMICTRSWGIVFAGVALCLSTHHRKKVE